MNKDIQPGMLVAVDSKSLIEKLAIVAGFAHGSYDGWWRLQSIKGGVYGEIHEDALIPIIKVRIPNIACELNIQEYLAEIIAELVIRIKALT